MLHRRSVPWLALSLVLLLPLLVQAQAPSCGKETLDWMHKDVHLLATWGTALKPATYASYNTARLAFLGQPTDPHRKKLQAVFREVKTEMVAFNPVNVTLIAEDEEALNVATACFLKEPAFVPFNQREVPKVDWPGMTAAVRDSDHAKRFCIPRLNRWNLANSEFRAALGAVAVVPQVAEALAAYDRVTELMVTEATTTLPGAWWETGHSAVDQAVRLRSLAPMLDADLVLPTANLYTATYAVLYGCQITN